MSTANTVTGYLRGLADDELYRRNAFRVTGLDTEARPRAIRERQKKVEAAAAVGADVAVSGDTRFPLPQPPGHEQLRGAFEVLADPRRRLVHELFWLWGEDTATCGCAPETHRVHDGAVRGHAGVLDRELAGPTVAEARNGVPGWADARQGWMAALDDAGTWAHLRHRVRALDDRRRLDEDAVDELRPEVLRALAATVVARAVRSDDPARLVAEAGRWLPPRSVDDMIIEGAGPRLDRVENALDESGERLNADEPLAAIELLRPRVVRDLDWLEDLAPHRRFRRLAELRNVAAVAFNNCALAVAERRDFPQALTLFDDALRLANDERGRRTVETNRHDVLRLQRAVEANREEARRLQRVEKALAPYGLSVAEGGAQALADRLTSAFRMGHYREAAQITASLLEFVDDPGQRAELEVIRQRALQMSAGVPPGSAVQVPGSASRSRMKTAGAVVVGLLLMGLGYAAFGAFVVFLIWLGSQIFG